MSKEKMNLDLVSEMEFDGYPTPKYGVCSYDDLDDVFCSYAEYDGVEMSDQMLDTLNDDHSDFMWETAFDQLCS